MEECHLCHVPETKAILFEVVSHGGVVKVCGRCYGKSSFPLVKKNPYEIKFREQSVRERMIKISGVNPERYRRQPEKASENLELKKIVDSNAEKSAEVFDTGPDAKKDLAYNFHWIVMRGRRSKHITQAQLGESIKEPESVIRMIEKGNVPKDKNILRKIEGCLDVRLRKTDSYNSPSLELQKYPERISNIMEREESKGMKNENHSTEDKEYVILKETADLTIADLQEMKRKRDGELFR